MGNSPSRSNNNTIVPKSSTNNQQQLTQSDDLNANEPNDPDDSSPSTINKKNARNIDNISIPTTNKSSNNFKRTRKIKNNSPTVLVDNKYDATNQNSINLRKSNPESYPSSAINVVSPGKKSKSGKSSFNLDIDISLAKAFSASNVISSNSDYGSSNSSASSCSSSENTLFTNNNQALTKEESYSSTNSFMKQTSTGTATTAINAHTHISTSQLTNKISHSHSTVHNSSVVSNSFSSVPNHRSVNTPIFLNRYSHDPSNSEGLDIDDVIEKLLKIGESRSYKSKDFAFHSWEIQLICYHAREIFMNQPSLLKLQAPIKVVGDVHGQFTDLLRILKLSGVPPDTNYLFLGDYVDRGKQSLETILLLLCYKIKYKDNFFMLRGNHESANVTKMYGFYDECKRRKNTKLWKMFIDVFNTLPFAAVIQDKIFCVHGGISPELRSMSQISNIKRPTDIPDEGLITDILWSDPDSQAQTWSLNDRGVSYTFGKKTVAEFCSQFKFDLIIRGHMVVEDGYEFFAKKRLVTVFSAPNYCGEFQNWGAVMSVTTGLMCSFELLKPHLLMQKKSKK